MPSTQTSAHLSLALTLAVVFLVGSTELQIAVGTLLSWALSHIALRRFGLLAAFRRVHLAYVFVTFWLLVATNDLFYINTFGRTLDLFFARDSLDPDMPGSGFTDWHEYLRYRNRHGIEFAWHLLRSAVRWSLCAVALPFLVVLGHWLVTPCPTTILERRFAHMTETGEMPPPSKKETRYCRLGDDIIFVCGPVGVFDNVIAGDYDGAILRRRGFYRQFA
ncbi:hypothetical protein EJ02DRAFT_161345 [Clathrospora elynae]|uniref:Uncharacterized protein n=1 Tax=Clathrospora elynae TaxID=706981 RepID=A0A6A5SSI2_9PLEO|nr:hypothetical protein EJ02DRAFT_161345 [Clathrospora elynae]